MTDKQEPNDALGKREAIVRGTLTAIVCAVIGWALISLSPWAGTEVYGITMFVVLPAACGFVTVFSVPYGQAVGVSISIALVVCLVSLVFTGIEGIICVVMALPLLAVAALVGAGIGAAVRSPRRRNGSLAVMPLLVGATVVGSGHIEDRLTSGPRSEVVRSSVVIDAPLDDVWNEMVAFDEVTGDKPLLMRMGLPVPQSCTMTGTGVDAERTCHFDTGFIRERVTCWDPPHRLEFAVEQVELPGRHWLGFTDAVYALETTDAGHTRVTRTTTVTSTLKPAIYWRYFERLGTRTEHRYILNSLAETLSARHSPSDQPAKP